MRCLIHRAFKISASYIIFHNKWEKHQILLQKNIYSKSAIDNQIKTFLYKQSLVDSGTTYEKLKKTLHYSLPYIEDFSHVTEKKLSDICEPFYKDTGINIAFAPMKLKSIFSSKGDTLPKFIESYFVYQFTCAGCEALYIDETKRHFKARVKEHLEKDKKSHIYSHLQKFNKIHNTKKRLFLIVWKL